MDLDLSPTQYADKALCSDDPQAVARMYAEAMSQRDAWRTAVSDIEIHLYAVMEGHGVKRLELPGVGMLEASRRVKRTGWRFDELLGDIARAVDGNRRLRADGEIEPPEWVMARLVGECISFSGGKVTGIRKVLPNDVDEYCTQGEAEPQVRLQRADVA